MKKLAAVVALLAFTSAAQADIAPTTQIDPFRQQGNDAIRDNPLLTFEPFDFTSGALSEATLRITAGYTPSFFNVSPASDNLLKTGICIMIYPALPICVDVTDSMTYIGFGTIVGSPVNIDRTFDVTAAIASHQDALLVSYSFGTAPPNGSAIDSTYYSGSAILTYYDPPLPVPEPSPLGITALALLSIGLIRRKC